MVVDFKDKIKYVYMFLSSIDMFVINRISTVGKYIQIHISDDRWLLKNFLMDNNIKHNNYTIDIDSAYDVIMVIQRNRKIDSILNE